MFDEDKKVIYVVHNLSSSRSEMCCFKTLTLIVFQLHSLSSAEPLLDALNGVQQYMEGGQPIFDQLFYNELIQCLDQLDPRMLQSAGAQWDGMITYANAGGSLQNNDTWSTCDETLRYMEYNCTTQEYGSMPIFEPCDYASNIAYYHTSTEICARKDWTLSQLQVNYMGITYALLAQGSAFWHGSQTRGVGLPADTKLNDLFAFVAYQAAVENLGPRDNSIIHDLSPTPRDKSAIDITSEFVDMYIEVPVEEWGKLLDSSDIPNLRLTMCGYFGTVLSLLYEPEIVDEIVDYLLNAFDLGEDIEATCLQEFIPEMRLILNQSEILLTSDEFFKLEGNTIGTVIKLLYAFLWQEEELTDDPIWLEPSTNEVGWAFLPVINQLANDLISWNHNNPEMQLGNNMYPGEEWCNPIIPHAKWHLETSIALTDFTFLTEELYRIFNKA